MPDFILILPLCPLMSFFCLRIHSRITSNWWFLKISIIYVATFPFLFQMLVFFVSSFFPWVLPSMNRAKLSLNPADTVEKAGFCSDWGQQSPFLLPRVTKQNSCWLTSTYTSWPTSGIGRSFEGSQSSAKTWKQTFLSLYLFFQKPKMLSSLYHIMLWVLIQDLWPYWI